MDKNRGLHYKKAKVGASFVVPDLDGGEVRVTFDAYAAARYNRMLEYYLKGIIGKHMFEFEDFEISLTSLGSVLALVISYLLAVMQNRKKIEFPLGSRSLTFKQVFESYDPEGYAKCVKFYAQPSFA